MSDFPPGRVYEDRIKNLLKLLCFREIKGGPNFKIGGNQIDALGIVDNKLVIIECTTKRTKLREKIETWKGKQGRILSGIQKEEKYREYLKEVKFIIASNSKKIENYKEIASSSPNEVIIWGPKKVNYYEELAKTIPSRAKYDVLDDLGFSLNSEENVCVPAIKIENSKTEMFSFFINPLDLIKISSVAHRESGMEKYYQRMVKKQRLNEIKKFLHKGKIFPTNIVISINEKTKFEKINSSEIQDISPKWLSFGKLTFPKSYKSCWVIDGQHRLFSFEKGMKQKIAVVAFQKIKKEEQMNFFIDINENAKPISSSLMWDLNGEISPENEKGIISNAVKQMNQDGPFQEKISAPSLGKGRNRISITSFCSSLQKSGFGKKQIIVPVMKHYQPNPFHNKNYKKFSTSISKSMKYYFKSIINLVAEENQYLKDFIISNGGVSVFIYLYKYLICLEHKGVDKEMKDKYLKFLIDFLNYQNKNTIENYTTLCSSEAGKNKVVLEMLEKISQINPDIKSFFPEEKLDLEELEKTLRDFLYKKVKNIKFDEFISKIDKKHFSKKIKTAKEKSDPLKFFISQTTLGEINFIMTQSFYWKNIFEDIFIQNEEHDQKKEEFKYPNEQIFFGHFKLVIKNRNNKSHGKSNISDSDRKIIIEFIFKLNNIIKFEG